MGSGLTLGILKMLQSSVLSMSAHSVCQDMHSKIYGKKEIVATFLHYQPRDLRSLLGGDSSQHSLDKNGNRCNLNTGVCLCNSADTSWSCFSKGMSGTEFGRAQNIILTTHSMQDPGDIVGKHPAFQRFLTELPQAILKGKNERFWNGETGN